MTKRVNKLFLIVAVFFIMISVLIPIVDYYATKTKLMDKGQFTTSEALNTTNFDMCEQLQLSIVSFDNFYTFFAINYDTLNTNSIMYKAINSLKTGDFSSIEVWENSNPEANETMFLFYILDKILWLFVAYCIFVIPISMVDLFSKAIKKGVE